MTDDFMETRGMSIPVSYETHSVVDEDSFLTISCCSFRPPQSDRYSGMCRREESLLDTSCLTWFLFRNVIEIKLLFAKGKPSVTENVETQSI